MQRRAWKQRRTAWCHPDRFPKQWTLASNKDDNNNNNNDNDNLSRTPFSNDLSRTT